MQLDLSQTRNFISKKYDEARKGEREKNKMRLLENGTMTRERTGNKRGGKSFD